MTLNANFTETSTDHIAPFPLVFGLDTFGDVTEDQDGHPLSHAQTIRNLVDEGVLAEQVCIDFFGIGEHHTGDFPLSAADVVLAAIAARTSRIHLGSERKRCHRRPARAACRRGAP